MHYNGKKLVHGSKDGTGVCRIVASNVPLSFWGGIDPLTGIVIDASHPLHGQSVAGSILCLPSGRGSCTASQVLLELILNGMAPEALVLRDSDGLVSIGALIAKSVFPECETLNIARVDQFEALLAGNPQFGQVLSDGSVVAGSHSDNVREEAEAISSSLPAESLELSLTEEEKGMLESAQTDAERRAVECIVQYARINSDLPQYIDVEKAHIDGCTYIGPGGLEFVRRLVAEGGRVRIPTTLNSVSTDLRHWDRLGIIPTESQQASIQLANAYLELGCIEQSFTCAPYLLDDPPRKGQHIVWGESNAVVYANSVLGARTEKYADYLDICCAIVGKVPAVGVHFDEKRMPQVVLDASSLDFSSADQDQLALLFPVLGHLCGSLSDGETPILTGLEELHGRITRDHLKAFCAAFGTTGTSPLIHIAGVTPEALEPDDMIQRCTRRQAISAAHLDGTFRLLDQHEARTEEQVDLISLGNPHLSLPECEQLEELVGSLPSTMRRKHDNVRIVACMSRVLYEKSTSIPALRDFGIEFVQDTCWCMLLEPPMIPTNPNATILTNSGKYAHYGPGLTARKFRLGTMAECVRAATSGSLERRPHENFQWVQSRRYSVSPRSSGSGVAARLRTSTASARRLRPRMALVNVARVILGNVRR